MQVDNVQDMQCLKYRTLSFSCVVFAHCEILPQCLKYRTLSFSCVIFAHCKILPQ